MDTVVHVVLYTSMKYVGLCSAYTTYTITCSCSCLPSKKNKKTMIDRLESNRPQIVGGAGLCYVASYILGVRSGHVTSHGRGNGPRLPACETELHLELKFVQLF